jgi:hypothetical protein
MMEREPAWAAGLMRTTLAGSGRARPSIRTITSWPGAMPRMSLVGTATSISILLRSTTSSSLLSIETFSPGCTLRLATSPVIGARITVSASALRDTSSTPRAESTLARAMSYWLDALS